MSKILEEQDFKAAAEQLGCEVAVIKAVCQVEAPKGGFGPDGLPIILFEPYLFGDLTKHNYDNQTVSINGVVYPLSINRRILPWTVANAHYGPVGIQHKKLEAAKKFDSKAAIQACSWGKFQILGSNYRMCGFATPEDFVAKMFISEREHLNAFVAFCKSAKLDTALKTKNFEEFAYHYNGPRQDKGTKNDKDDYDYFLKIAYEKAKKAV